MITILDYGEGNIRNVERAFQHLNQTVKVTDSILDIANASTLVVPGQGAFKQAMSKLKEKQLIEPIKNHINHGKKFLGICLGFQILFETSQEHGIVEGLNIFPGHLTKIHHPPLKVPHMGWNKLSINNDCDMFNHIEDNSFVYFVHSFYLEDTTQHIISSKTTYGKQFISAIQQNHVWGTQFHPEKSGDIGLKILENFINYKI
jgi:glutamine amidotransferase